MKRMLIYFLIFVVTWFGLILLIQRRFIYPRHMASLDSLATVDDRETEPLWLETDQGRVEYLLALGSGVSAAKPGPAVIFAHGNGEIAHDWPEFLDRYRQIGVTVMIPEYRGYGRSGGSPSQTAIVGDFLRCYDLLIARPEVDRGRVVFHGRSLGAGVVCALAAQRTPTAMILQSGFVSVADVAKRFLVPRFLVLDPYDNVTVLSNLERPVLLMHGHHDWIIPCGHSRRLHALARNSKLILYNCGHNDLPPDRRNYWSEIEGFLRENHVLSGKGTAVTTP